MAPPCKGYASLLVDAQMFGAALVPWNPELLQSSALPDRVNAAEVVRQGPRLDLADTFSRGDSNRSPRTPASTSPPLTEGAPLRAQLWELVPRPAYKGNGVDEDLNSPQRLAWEKSVISAARRGERTAWAQLYQAYAGLLFSRILYPRLGNRAAAEDALAETYRVAIERIEQYEPRGSSIFHWLARIAVNKATDMHRARAVTGRALVNLESKLAPLLDAPLTPDMALDCKKQYFRVRDALTRCLAELNPRYRRAIELRFFEEKSREECAASMEVKIGTFDVLLLRSLKALRKQWDMNAPDAKEGSRVETA